MIWPAKSGCAGVVQSAEQPPRKRQVGGSMPSAGPADLGNETTGTTTTHGRVPAAATGTGCSPVGPRAFASSSLASPTGTVAGGYYRGRVVEMVQAAACKVADTGSNPVASSEPEGFEGCTIRAPGCAGKLVGDAPARKALGPRTARSTDDRGAMVEWYNTRLSPGRSPVRTRLAPPSMTAESDSTDRFGGRAGVAQMAARHVANVEAAGSNPASRTGSPVRGGGTLARHGWAGVAQLVERQPSKLNVASSILVSRSGVSTRGRQVERHRVHTSATVRSNRTPATTLSRSSSVSSIVVI